MGWFSGIPILGDVEEAVTEAADDVYEAASSAWEDAESWVSEATSDAEGWFEEAWSDAGTAFEDVGEGLVTALGDAGGALGDGVGWFGTAVDTATFGLAGEGMKLLDTAVFDTVDYVTGGVINIDYDGHGFSTNIGLGELGSWGARIGDNGITAHGEIPGGSNLNFGMTDEGFSVSGSAGINLGPLPYAAGHIEVTADGDVMINGQVQGTIPTPLGMLSGEASGGFMRTDQGWGGYIEADGALYMPEGTTIGGSVGGQYLETPDGTMAGFNLGGYVSQQGIGTVGGTLGYQRLERDGDVLESFAGNAYASGFGAEVSGNVNYAGGQVDGQSFGDWSGDLNSEGLDADSLMQIGKSLFGEVGGEGGLPDSLDGLVSQLGDGQAGQLLQNLVGGAAGGEGGGGGGDLLSGFISGLGGDAASQFVNQLAGEGALNDLIGNLPGDAAQQLIGKVAETGGLADVFSNLDPSTTADLVGKLVSGSGAGAIPGAAQVMDAAETLQGAAGQYADQIVGEALQEVEGVLGSDILGTTGQPPSEGIGTMTAPPPGARSDVGDDVLGVDGVAAPVGTEPMVAAAPTGVDTGIPDLPTAEVEGPAAAPAVPDVPAAPAPAPEPDTFTQKVEAADEVESSLDDMFDDLG